MIHRRERLIKIVYREGAFSLNPFQKLLKIAFLEVIGIFGSNAILPHTYAFSRTSI